MKDKKSKEQTTNNNSVDLSKLTNEQLIQMLEKEKELTKALISENEQLIVNQEQLDKKIAKTDEYINQVVMLKNDFDSFRRRNKEVEQASNERGRLAIIEQLLPILDTFDRAKQNITDKPSLEAFELILKQYNKILSDAGVTEIDVLNKDFDVNNANAVTKVEVKEQLKNKVLEVYAKGYKYTTINGDIILRYAQVSVGV